MNGNRGGGVAVIVEGPLGAAGGVFKLSQQLTNGQPCFHKHTHHFFFYLFFFFSTREKDVFSISNDGFISVSTTIFTLVLVLYTVLAVQ